MADLHRLPHRLGDARPGRVDQLAGRRARDEDPRQVEQQRRVLVAARIQPGQRHQEFAAAQVGIADQVEGGIGRDEAVVAERAQQMRAAVADRAFDLGRASAPRAGAAARLGLRMLSSMVSSRSATGWPIAAQSGASSSRAGDQRLAQAVEPRRVAQFGQPGPAQQRPQRRIAERGPVEFGQMRVAAGGVAAAGDRRRHRATGRPSGPSARGRRHRRNPENSWNFFPAVRALPSHASPDAARPASAPRRPNACKSLKSYPNSQETQM